MSEYRKHAAFLRTLMMYDDTKEHRALCERMVAAEKNERCLLCACRLVGLIALLGLVGIGYSAVLLPEFFDNRTHVIIRFFTALGLGSSLCFGFFLALWFWYRSASNRIHTECRRAITSMLDSRLKTATATLYPALVDDPNLKVPVVRNSRPSSASVLTGLSKAS